MSIFIAAMLPLIAAAFVGIPSSDTATAVSGANLSRGTAAIGPIGLPAPGLWLRGSSPLGPTNLAHEVETFA